MRTIAPLPVFKSKPSEPKLGPPKPHNDEERIIHIDALAGVMKRCIDDDTDPKGISIAGPKGRVLIGPPRFAYWLPLSQKGQTYNLGAILQIVQSVHPAIWRAAEERAGGFHWRAAETRWRARRMPRCRGITR